MRKMIFTMGLPGSGKSGIANKRFPDAYSIDPDAIKASHPNYDPERPELLHVWSKMVAEDQFSGTVMSNVDMTVVVDGTGTNVEPMINKIRRARAAGWQVELLFVVVTLAVALERNAKRERTVPEALIREKAATIYTAFEVVSAEIKAGNVEIVYNG